MLRQLLDLLPFVNKEDRYKTSRSILNVLAVRLAELGSIQNETWLQWQSIHSLQQGSYRGHMPGSYESHFIGLARTLAQPLIDNNYFG